MVRIKKYEDGDRLIISFENLSQLERNNLDDLIKSFDCPSSEQIKIPDIKPLALLPLDSNSKVDTEEKVKDAVILNKEIIQNSIEQNNLSPDLMTVYEIKTALTNLTGHAKEILEENFKTKGFYNLELYLDLTSENELRKVLKNCI